MRKIIELETDEEFAEFEEILSKVCSGNIVGTLRQAVKKSDGEYSYVDLQQAVSSSKTLVQINDNYFYITVQDVHSEEVRKMQSMWNMILSRGTQRFLNGEANDYLLTVDLVRSELEKGSVAYCISAVQPIFVTSENARCLTFVFELDNVRCSKDEVSIYDIEYEAALREESGNDVYKMSDYDEDEGDDGETFDENSDILNMDEYTTGSSYLGDGNNTDVAAVAPKAAHDAPQQRATGNNG